MAEMLQNRSGRRAVLLLAHGAPDTLDDIPEFLRNVTGGRPLPAPVVDEIKHRYGLIGQSPLTRITLEQAELLAQSLQLPVYVGMRNWKPYIADTLRRMREDGVVSAVVLCLAPQNSRTSVGLYRRAVFSAVEGLDLEFVESWAGHPLLAQAFAERLRPLQQRLSQDAGHPVPVLFTAHSVPCRTVQSAEGAEPDPYPSEAKRTAANVAALLPDRAAGDWYFAFQSQGMSGGPWIGPTVEDTLTALRRQGVSTAIIQAVGFLCDHVEILYDIDVSFKNFAAGIGLEVQRPLSLNDSPLLIAALADIARQGLARLSERQKTAAAIR